MSKYKILVLTDHSNHSKENSLYALTKALRAHPKYAQMDIATRGFEANDSFFQEASMDTLVGDDGVRVLSEINTTSIGGLPQIARLLNQPLVEKAADLLWAFISEKSEARPINLSEVRPNQNVDE
ncbi:MAG: hypothetical protein AAF960_12580 [Bacteroidota bacterium]